MAQSLGPVNKVLYVFQDPSTPLTGIAWQGDLKDNKLQFVMLSGVEVCSNYKGLSTGPKLWATQPTEQAMPAGDVCLQLDPETTFDSDRRAIMVFKCSIKGAEQRGRSNRVNHADAACWSENLCLR